MIYDRYLGKLTGGYQGFDGVRAIHVTVPKERKVVD